MLINLEISSGQWWFLRSVIHNDMGDVPDLGNITAGVDSMVIESVADSLVGKQCMAMSTSEM